MRKEKIVKYFSGKADRHSLRLLLFHCLISLVTWWEKSGGSSLKTAISLARWQQLRRFMTRIGSFGLSDELPLTQILDGGQIGSPDALRYAHDFRLLAERLPNHAVMLLVMMPPPRWCLYKRPSESLCAYQTD